MCVLLALIAGCFVLTDRELPEHDARLQPPPDGDTDTVTSADTETDTDTDADGDADTDADADTDSETPTDTSPTGDTGTVTVPWLLPTCPASPPDDAISVSDPTTAISVAGDELVIPFSYGCGCANHNFGACFGPGFGGASPPTLPVQLVHDANGDTCLALCFDEIRVDLLQVQGQYLASYGAASGAVDLEVAWTDSNGAQLQVVPYAW